MNPAQYWQRKAALVHRSERLRERVEFHVTALGPAWKALDTTQRGVVWIRKRPWVLGLGLLFLVRRPRVAVRWSWRAWRAWRWLQAVSSKRPGLEIR